MNIVLQKFADAEAVQPTKVLINRSFLPVAVLVRPAVSFLKPTPTNIAEETAARYPRARSVLV